MKLVQNIVLAEHSKEKTGKEPPPDALIMDKLKISLATTVYKARGKISGSIVESFIEPRASTTFFHPVYSLDGQGTSMTVSGAHEEFFNSDFGIWIGGKYFHMVAVYQ